MFSCLMVVYEKVLFVIRWFFWNNKLKEYLVKYVMLGLVKCYVFGKV